MDEGEQKSCWGVAAKAVVGFAGILLLGMVGRRLRDSGSSCCEAERSDIGWFNESADFPRFFAFPSIDVMSLAEQPRSAAAKPDRLKRRKHHDICGTLKS